MSKSLKILFVCSEMSPLAGTGGLAEVAGALPCALRKLGHDVRAALPFYRVIPRQSIGENLCECRAVLAGTEVLGALHEGQLSDEGLPLYLIEHRNFFDREHLYGENGSGYRDNVARFSFSVRLFLTDLKESAGSPILFTAMTGTWLYCPPISKLSIVKIHFGRTCRHSLQFIILLIRDNPRPMNCPLQVLVQTCSVQIALSIMAILTL